ncbi:MAG TPA: hypothetical protein VNA29_07160 [Sphingomicrobium sp.]|nr:hypothetical protein [Sphingomicrobium sp.]
MNYLDEGRRLWERYVPRSGQADTVQGELLRSVEKLRDEAIRNGNGNWDEGFEILLTYLEQHLFDAGVFPPEVIERSRVIINALRNWRVPVLEDEPYDYLGDRVVDYYDHYGSTPHSHNPALGR